MVNFLVTGALYIACATGMRRLVRSGPGRRWIPALLYVCGAGIAGGGVFHPDPGDGFPPGTPADASVVSSWHGVLHQVCGSSAFLALIALCFVFGRRFARAGQRRMAVGSRIAGTLFAVALPAAGAPGGALTLCAGVAIGMFWTAFASARIIASDRFEAALTARTDRRAARTVSYQRQLAQAGDLRPAHRERRRVRLGRQAPSQPKSYISLVRDGKKFAIVR